jgi:hypothetical protein
MDQLIATAYVVKYSPHIKKVRTFVQDHELHTHTHTHARAHYATDNTCLKITDSRKIARKLTITSTSATMKGFSNLLMSSCHLAVVHFVQNALIAF